MKTIAIVILNWNGKDLLHQLLGKVVENSQHQGVRIIVADNASTDGSIEYLKSEHPHIELIELDENYGFAGGYNKALMQVDADYYLLLNSDVLPESNWLEHLYIAINKYPDVAVLMPKIRSFNQPSHFEYAGAAGGFIDKFGYTFCRGRLFNIIEEDTNQYPQDSDIFWASGAAFLIKSELYHNAGGLDESFFAHMEEVDLCWRLKNSGHRIMYISNSTVYHIGGASLHHTNPKKTYLNFRNNLYLLVKNLPEERFFSIMFQRMVLDGIAFSKFIVSLDPKFAFAILKAHLSFYIHLPSLLKQRRELKSNRTVSKHNEIYQKSIVFDFYFKKNKRFSNLKFNI